MNFLVVVNNGNYIQDAIKLVKEKQKDLSNGTGKVLYITLRTPYRTILAVSSHENIPLDSLVVVDSITKKGITTPEIATNCIYIPPDSEPEELPAILNLLMKKCDFCGIVLDSLSLLGKHHGDNDVVDLAESIMDKVKKEGCCSMFIVEKGDLTYGWGARIKDKFDETIEI